MNKWVVTIRGFRNKSFQTRGLYDDWALSNDPSDTEQHLLHIVDCSREVPTMHIIVTFPKHTHTHTLQTHWILAAGLAGRYSARLCMILFKQRHIFPQRGCMHCHFRFYMTAVMADTDKDTTLGSRASDSLCLMVTMLVPHTEKIPLFTELGGGGGETLPILAKTRTFVVRKIVIFFRFQGEHIAWWSLLKQIEDIHYSCNTFFFAVWFSSCFLLVVVKLEHYISWKCKAITVQCTNMVPYSSRTICVLVCL